MINVATSTTQQTATKSSINTCICSKVMFRSLVFVVVIVDTDTDIDDDDKTRIDCV